MYFTFTVTSHEPERTARQGMLAPQEDTILNYFFHITHNMSRIIVLSLMIHRGEKALLNKHSNHETDVICHTEQKAFTDTGHLRITLSLFQRTAQIRMLDP